MPRAHRTKARSENERLPIGTRVLIRKNRVHPRLAGYAGELVAYSGGHVTNPGLVSPEHRGKRSGGGKPIVLMGGQRFLFRPEDIEKIQGSAM